ncbi:MAG: putative beta-lysine N-acetyltransferase [Cyclobacteriaceae bacterium]|nr:putative beta-lysine N-acetyltransferase [Cyclobacteriaceae bacterium]
MVKVPEWALEHFLAQNYKLEGSIPHLYGGKEKGYFLSMFFSAKRSYLSNKNKELIKSVKTMASRIKNTEAFEISDKYQIRKINKEDVPQLARLYKNVFDVYPFPIFKEVYLSETMEENVIYYGVFKDNKLLAASSAELDLHNLNAEMTDFATHPDFLGRKFSYFLLKKMEKEMAFMGIKTLYTIARATSHGMNKTFGRLNYAMGGTLVNNTLIGQTIESMNVWYKNI